MKKFLQRIRQLRKDYPTDKPVIVYTKPNGKVYVNGHKSYGYCYFSDKRDAYVIIIERNDDICIMVDTLWHEYAHILTWHTATLTHCKKFFDAYGDIYRRYVDNEGVTK